MSLIKLDILKTVPPYVPGDVCSLPPEIAKGYLENGLAKPHGEVDLSDDTPIVETSASQTPPSAAPTDNWMTQSVLDTDFGQSDKDEAETKEKLIEFGMESLTDVMNFALKNDGKFDGILTEPQSNAVAKFFASKRPKS